MARSFNERFAEFLSGAQVGRDNVRTVTIEELEKQVEGGQRIKALEIAQKIWAELKWKLKKRDYKKTEVVDMISDAIIEVGLKVKHEQTRKEVIEKFEAMKAELNGLDQPQTPREKP